MLVLLSLVVPNAVSPLIARVPIRVFVGGTGSPGAEFFGPLASAGYSVVVSENDRDVPAAFAYVSAASLPRNTGNDEAGRTFRDASEVEKWKSFSASGKTVVVEPGAWSADRGPVVSSGMAAFLGARNSGWRAQYLADPASAAKEKNVTESVRRALARRADSLPVGVSRLTPCIALENEDGRTLFLESGIDFDGKAPLIRIGGRAAPLYARVFLNDANPELAAPGGVAELGAHNEGTVDFGLTEAGRATLASIGVGDPIPAAVLRRTPFSQTLSLNVDFSAIGADYGTGQSFGLAWYRSRFAMFHTDSGDAAYWRALVPLLLSVAKEASAAGTGPVVAAADSGISAQAQASTAQFTATFRAAGKNLWKRNTAGEWVPFIVKGVDLGPALPGKAFTEFPVDESVYYRWFAMMRGMNLNTVRVYTLLPPAFYRALRAYNLAHAGSELFLLQEIWPEENPPSGNYLDRMYTDAFFAEIDRVIGCAHGDGDISPRQGRAWGKYSDDVSHWVLAFLIGRELEPAEVSATDSLNRGYAFSGGWFSSTAGSPTEAWLASACDRAAKLEIGRYSCARPISVVSWPPLDPVSHWVEWRDPDVIASGKSPLNDFASIDISHIDVAESFVPGFFGSYHIYPNYPDFMVTTPWYSKYRDSEGSFRYGGYLREFMMGHARYPALLAEYGMSTSFGIAHLAPDGMHHGGQSESVQGNDIVRMTKAALAEGFAGTVIFEWIDEWAKKTWTTEPYMIPLARHMDWHNALDPEQYYGLVATEGVSSFSERKISLSGKTGLQVSSLGIVGDETYLRLSLDSATPWLAAPGTVCIALDVADRQRGLRSFPRDLVPSSAGIPALPSGCEFLVSVTVDADQRLTARILTEDSCNPGLRSYSLDSRAGDSFSPVNILVNRISVDSLGKTSPRQLWDRSILPVGDFSDSRNCVSLSGTSLEIRIPWGLLNVSDPSTLRVIDDPRSFASDLPVDGLRTVESEGIIAYGAFVPAGGDSTFGNGTLPRISQAFPLADGGYGNEWRYDRAHWDVPRWTQREKRSIPVLRDFFGTY